ncbi:MAG TPA: hypothetical protein VLM85_09115, partial [Polyangiaceae bacterium]|nr:hypothetical protein [Polyangiaceae bacterium]
FYNANYAGASLAIDALLGFMSNPDGVGFYGELGGGYRTISYGNMSTGGGEFVFGLGMQFKWGSFRIIPKADFYIGSFSDPNDSTISFIHGFFTLGVSGYWELPLSKPSQPATAAPPPAY